MPWRKLCKQERKGDASLFLALPKKRRLEGRKVYVPFSPPRPGLVFLNLTTNQGALGVDY
ncbi:MAG TPA: hypothetical protein DCZ05_00880 [Deltaproteobacteria bacterium]|nr:hypothetical protein [Deltaproteobacteria bacterium]